MLLMSLFFCFFSAIFLYQPIRCSDLIEVKNHFFTPFNRFCQVPAYLLRGPLLNICYNNCKPLCPYIEPYDGRGWRVNSILNFKLKRLKHCKTQIALNRDEIYEKEFATN